MDAEQRKTLGKDERVYGEKRVDALFTNGSSFISYPLRIVFIERQETEMPHQIAMMVSVSKRKFKRAVKRNRVKRLVKEAFRLHKQEYQLLCQEFTTSIDIAFIYLKDELPDFKEIEKSIQKTLVTLRIKLEEKQPHA